MDFEYLSRRYEDELKRATEAATQPARDAHLALADQYLAEIERLRAVNTSGGMQAATA